MSSIAELFGEEISDITKHVKPEEEIMKYSTADDLGEVKRGVHLLKKGYQTQKISIIENLHVSVQEPQANEELIPIILSSMEGWDMSMQKECAKSFQREETLRAMNQGNLVKLMDELLTIVMNVDITQEEFIEEWLKVFRALCPFLQIEYLRYTVIKRIQDLPSLKQTLPWRRVGFSMFWSLIMAKGEELLKDEPLAMKMVLSMCGDNNWRIRKEAAKYLAEFLKELHKLKPAPGSKTSNGIIGKPFRRQISLFGTFSPIGRDLEEDSFSFTDAAQVGNISPGGPLPENCKLSKQRFRDDFYELVADLTADQELLVRQEGIEIFIDMLPYVTKADLEQDFLPRLKETLEDMTKDDLADDAAEIRMIYSLGNTADKLAKCGYLKPSFSDEFRLDKIFLEYFRACMTHQVQGVRKGAAYNLPCFYLYFRFWEPNLESSFNEFDDSRIFLDKYYLELCQDPNTPLDILVTLASGIHEILQLFPQDQKLPAPIQESLKILFNAPQWEIKEALAKNIDKIIKAYWRKEEQTLIVEEVRNFYDEAIKKGPEMFKNRKQQNVMLNTLQSTAGNQQDTTKNTSNAATTGEDASKSLETPKRKSKKGGASDALMNAGTTIGFGGFNQPKNDIAQSKLEGIYAVYLQTIIDIEVCPEEFQYEYLYSRFFETMLPLTLSILTDATKWRTQEIFLKNLGNSLSCFNPQEIQELLLPRILEKVRYQSNDQVKQACCWVIATLIQGQYKKGKRKGLIDMMVQEFGKSKTFSLRKTFIMFCSSAIKVLSYQTFKQHFFDLYLSLAADKVTDVRITFLNSVCSIRPYLELDSTALNLFNIALSGFLIDLSQTVFELTSQVDLKLLKLKRQPLFGASKQEEANRMNAEAKLKERDQFEEEAKVKAGDSNKNKLEFLTTALQLQTMLGKKPGGAFGGSIIGAPSMKKLPGATNKPSNKNKSNTKELNPLKGVPNSAAQQAQQSGTVKVAGGAQKQNETQQQSTQQITGSQVIQQNGGLTLINDKNGSLIQKFRKKVKKENNSLLPPITGGTSQLGMQQNSSTGGTGQLISQQSTSQASQSNTISQLKTIRKVDISITQVIQKDSKIVDTQPLSSNTQISDSGKDSLLIQSTNGLSEKRLSFKDGSSMQDVARNYAQSNFGSGNRRSLVPRHSVSMSPNKKDQMNEVMALGSNTEVKQSQGDETKPSQLPLNMMPSGGSGGSIPHEVKQILWKNSIMTKIKEHIASSLPTTTTNNQTVQATQSQAQQQVNPQSSSQPSLLLSGSGPPQLSTIALSSVGFQAMSLTPNASSMNNNNNIGVEHNNFVGGHKPGTSNFIASKRRISSEDLDYLGRKTQSEDINNTENYSTNLSEQVVFSATGPIPRATNNALIPRQSRVMRAPPQFSNSPSSVQQTMNQTATSQFQLSPSGVVYTNSSGSPAPISKNVMPMRPPYFLQQKEPSLQQQQQQSLQNTMSQVNYLLPPLAQYLKIKNTHSRAAMQFSHQASHNQLMKTNENNSDILVVKLHGVAEVMNESKNLAAKRAQSSGGMEANGGAGRPRNPTPTTGTQQETQASNDSSSQRRPDSFQNKLRSGMPPTQQAAIVQQQIQQSSLGIPGQLANTRNAATNKAVKSYSELSQSATSTMLNSDSRQHNNYTTTTTTGGAGGQGSTQQMWNTQERKVISSSGHHSSTGMLNSVGGNGGTSGIFGNLSGGPRLISPKTQLGGGGTANFGNIIHIKERKM